MVELDTDYDGSFVADRILGTNSTSNLWEDMPQRIYLAGGAGVLWKDLEIITESAPVIGVEDLSIYMLSEGGASLFWTSVQGQTYDVVYKASLNAESWITDPSPGCSEIPGTGGIISVTSLVDDDQVFYSVFTE